ncbi:MAG: hypothetical protein NC338_08420 [Firmicutes bacterium]|nr:hypothetical protein [Bacillota bacterium]MCM1402094.1 hypothetical protein [Bacteroides sp.]MCM1476547.1 hypothetical protein [Bacteroides sp.]
MKRNFKYALISAAFVTAASAFSSCDALWGTSVEAGAPDNYYYGWDGEWLPSLAGAPLISPYYYGGTAYPVSNWRPVHRPGNNWGGQGGAQLPPPSSGIASGNLRPGQNHVPTVQPSQTPVPSDNSIVPSKPINLGSNPGIQLPPEGSGMKYTPTQGRH